MVPALLKEKKKKTSKSMKHKKKRKSSGDKSLTLNGDDDSSDDDLGLLSPSKKLHSISFYVNNRQEMISQMFSTITEEKVRAMLPPILKDESIEDLRSNCLEALLGMSSKRIKSVIGGEDLGSQSSETESDTAIESANEDSVSSSTEEIKEENRGSWKRGVPEKENNTPPVKKAATGESGADGQSLLEIVELQLRARAIRAALDHQCATEVASPETKPEADDDIALEELKSITIKEEKITSTLDNIPNESVKKNGVSTNTLENKETGPSKKSVNTSTASLKTGGDRVIVFKKNPGTGGSTLVITKNSSGPSKKNIIVIGPSRKQKNKIVYSSKKILILDSPDKAVNVEKTTGSPILVETQTTESVIEISSESDGSQVTGKTDDGQNTGEVEKEELVQPSADVVAIVPVKESENEQGKTTNKDGLDKAANIEDEMKESWVERWLQRSDSSTVAQKKTSKIITSAKQKLLAATRKKTESESEPQTTEAVEPVLIGTVGEYESLPQSTLPAFEAEIKEVVENLNRENVEKTVQAEVDVAPDSTVGEDSSTMEAATQDADVLIVETEERNKVPTLGIEDAVVEPALVDEITLELHYEETEDM